MLLLQEYFIEKLEELGSKPVPRVISSEYSIKEREAVYLEGGVLFITSRILVVDMLTERIPIHLISGILVYNAHKSDPTTLVQHTHITIETTNWNTS